MEKHCDLCDLPFAQCAHGLDKRQRRAARKAAKSHVTKSSRKSSRASKPPKERQLSSAEQAKLPAVLQGAKVVRISPKADPTKRSGCVECGQRRFSRYNICASCLRKQGGRECVRCGRLFRPPPGSKKARKCGTCHGKVAYTTTTMGAPSLGHRA